MRPWKVRPGGLNSYLSSQGSTSKYSLNTLVKPMVPTPKEVLVWNVAYFW